MNNIDLQAILLMAKLRGIKTGYDDSDNLLFYINDSLHKVYFMQQLRERLESMGYNSFNIGSGVGYVKLVMESVKKETTGVRG